MHISENLPKFKIFFPRICLKRWLNLGKVHKENIGNFASGFPHFVCVIIGPCALILQAHLSRGMAARQNCREILEKESFN